ncbi:MAG: hypothetical protein ACXVZT_00585 [Terriglobales bacterium]
MYRNAELALSLAARGESIGTGLATAAAWELRPLAGPGSSIFVWSAYEGLRQLAAGSDWQPIRRRWLAQLADQFRAIGEEEVALRALAAAIARRRARELEKVAILACA